MAPSAGGRVELVPDTTPLGWIEKTRAPLISNESIEDAAKPYNKEEVWKKTTNSEPRSSLEFKLGWNPACIVIPLVPLTFKI
jgi:hypothetical protein